MGGGDILAEWMGIICEVRFRRGYILYECRVDFMVN